MSHSLHDLIADWQERIDYTQRGHYLTADRFNRYHYVIGLPATILATIAGATLLTEADEPWVRITVGVVGLIAAVLSAVQTFYSYAKRAEIHRATAAQFGQVRREVEIVQQFMPTSKADQEQVIRQINEHISNIADAAPVIDISKVRKSRGSGAGLVLPGPEFPEEPPAKRSAASRHS